MKPRHSLTAPIRFLRLRDCPRYLGIDRNRFNVEVRPYLTTISIGKQGIAFDIVELDDWADDYKARVGIPAKKTVGRI